MLPSVLVFEIVIVDDVKERCDDAHHTDKMNVERSFCNEFMCWVIRLGVQGKCKCTEQCCDKTQYNKQVPKVARNEVFPIKRNRFHYMSWISFSYLLGHLV